jgi:hypothetical protein
MLNTIHEYELKGRKPGFKPKAAALDVLLNAQSLIKYLGAGVWG